MKLFPLLPLVQRSLPAPASLARSPILGVPDAAKASVLAALAQSDPDPRPGSHVPEAPPNGPDGTSSRPAQSAPASSPLPSSSPLPFEGRGQGLGPSPLPPPLPFEGRGQRLGEEIAPLLVVTSRPDRAVALAEEVAVWLSEPEAVAVFPELDSIPYQHVAPDSQASEQRLELLERLAAGPAPRVVIASGLALAQTTIAPRALAESVATLHVGSALVPDAFLERLRTQGYEFVSLVEQPGQASRRGGILDVFPAGAAAPVRIELFGNAVESLRSFDPRTQRSLARLDEVRIGPAQETLIPAGRIAELRSALDFSAMPPEAAEALEAELDAFEQGDTQAGSFWLPFLTAATLLDHLPLGARIVVDEPGELIQELADLDAQAEQARESLLAEHRLPEGLPLPHVARAPLLAALEAREPLSLQRWATEETVGATLPPFAPAGAFGGRLRTLSQEVLARMRAGWRVLLVSQQSPRLAELFQSEGLDPRIPLDSLPPAGSLRLLSGSLAHGWSLHQPGGGSDLLLLTDSEIFGFVKQRRAVRPVPSGGQAFLSELTPGDYVVHVEHGIARFAGLVNRTMDGVQREYLELRYAEGDKLFVPTDQIDRVSRYVGPGEHVPALTRLSTQEWARAKERVRRAVADLAQDLLQIYAAREALPGHAFPPDSGWQQEMEATFPYVETPDQLRALGEIKGDMEADRPMDRVIVGDVGYGKTELALRAAFKAVMDGMQVAVLVPTTVLAQQHLQTFTERLSGFPVRIEVLSRFRSDKEARQVIADLAAGSVDIVIGTHRLLQRDVTFKNLGLLVIDEEQRFGVAHKERFRQLRQQVDVLTLSATPIPRTLHMTLTGIRDMSTMETAPEERLPIKTFVAEWDDRIVRDAILREVDRGGQIYVVHNRVQSIDQIAGQIRRLVPEASVAVGHGQMPEEQLERVMLEFARGEYDVLICTTIIESGLDIPNVNTIVINQANRLGLGQLYQLRGRVGRGANRAYAYLLYDRNRSLSETAQKRLQTIFEATELGAGFQIALRDLEIRGAGNLLGSEQSGHIGAVGFDLYNRMLGEAVARLKALKRGEIPRQVSATPVTVDLPLPARIPEGYITDLNLRLAVYQRMAQVATVEEADRLAEELADRFGPPPPLVSNLLFILRLRALARAAGIVSILSEDGQVVLRSGGPLKDRARLQREVRDGVQVGTAQIRITRSADRQEWMQQLGAIVDTIAAIA
jgi:transcription-repair coupling factor (superfamily II helicase)